MNVYRGGIAVFGVLFVAIGVALVVVTVARGGGLLGYVMGVLFAALGVGRLYLLRLRAPRR